MSSGKPSLSKQTFSKPGLTATGIGLFLLAFESQYNRLGEPWAFPVALIVYSISTVMVVGGLLRVWVERPRFSDELPTRQSNLTRMSLPREGVIYLMMISMLLIGSLLGRSNLLLLVFCMMVGPFVINGQLTLMMLRNLQVGRRLPHRIMVGETTSVEILVENRKRWFATWLLMANDRIESRRERINARVLYMRIPSQQERSGHYRLRLMQRGRYEFGPINLSTRYPFGLVQRSVTKRIFDEVLVYPRIGQLTAAWRRENQAAAELVQKPRTRMGIYDDEVHHLREYRPGDNPRAIHWRSSARRNELIVREYHQSRDYDFCVAIDLWEPSSPTEADSDRTEGALSFAASLCVDHLMRSRDSRLTVVFYGRSFQSLVAQSGPGSLNEVLDAFALVEPGDSDAAEPLIDEIRTQQSPRTRTLIITTRRPDENDADSLQAFYFQDNIDQGRVDIIEADPQRLARYWVQSGSMTNTR